MSRIDPQMRVRIPQDVHDWLIEQRKRYGGSMNSEVVRALRTRMEGKPLTIVAIFHREGGLWYPLELSEDTDWAKHAALNPGTVKIENLDGDILWSRQ